MKIREYECLIYSIEEIDAKSIEKKLEEQKKKCVVKKGITTKIKLTNEMYDVILQTFATLDELQANYINDITCCINNSLNEFKDTKSVNQLVDKFNFVISFMQVIAYKIFQFSFSSTLYDEEDYVVVPKKDFENLCKMYQDALMCLERLVELVQDASHIMESSTCSKTYNKKVKNYSNESIVVSRLFNKAINSMLEIDNTSKDSTKK